MPHFIEVFFVSLVHGITEFLPISSTAHVAVIAWFYEFDVYKFILVNISLHLGSLLAVSFYFKPDLLDIFNNKTFLITMIIATMPVMFFGFIFVSTVEIINIKIIAWASLIFGILLYLSDKNKKNKTIKNGFNYKVALIIGLSQVLSLMPGVSRSGITITAGRFLGFDRYSALKISFFLSIPTLAMVSLYGVYSLYKEGNPQLSWLSIEAVILSFIFSYFTIKIFFNFVKKFNLNLIIVYRIIISCALLFIVYFYPTPIWELHK